MVIIKGFDGPEEKLKDLAKVLRQHCGVGGSAKNGQILAFFITVPSGVGAQDQRMIITEFWAYSMTLKATLPMKKRLSPVRPVSPITIKE